MENPAQSSEVTSGATGETMLSGCYLFTYEKRTELNSFESKILVLVTGIDSGAERSVVLVGKIPRHSVVRDSESGRVYKSATGERVMDQEQQQILGTVDGKVRGLHMRVAQARNSLTCVSDMCAAGHRVVFDFDNNNDGCEPCGKQDDWRENLLQVTESCAGTPNHSHPEDGNRMRS